MKHVLTVAAIVSLGGCAAALDPAPYNPVSTAPSPGWFGNVKPIAGQTTFDASCEMHDSTSGSDTPDPTAWKTCVQKNAAGLQTVADAYGAERDLLMRQSVLFDIPIIALGAAAVANPIFHGAGAATTALGLSGATLGGLKLYFGDGTRVQSYNNAATSLGCAANTGRTMADEGSADLTPATRAGITNLTAISMLDRLNTDIGTASTLLVNGQPGGKPLTASEKSDLLAARDKATTAEAAFSPAVSDIITAPTQLINFAYTVTGKTTNKIVGSSQNTNDVISSIKTAGTALVTTTTNRQPLGVTQPTPPKPGQPAPNPPSDAANLTPELNNLATTATTMSTRINAIWTPLTSTCALAS
ncbi:hypothetical protein [Acidiphilium sp.]|uniref:hypothetical protein n=1 Tax=Acidiphilium sp. TaxID=527 RepID=UPI003CFC6048